MGSHTQTTEENKSRRAMHQSIIFVSLITAVLSRPGSIKEYPVECPESTDGFPVFLPHPTDCTKYYECQGDWPILMECAPPLYFDPSISVCNWPNMVDCQQPTTEEPATTTTASSNSTEGPINNSTTVEPDVNSTTEEQEVTTEVSDNTTEEQEVTTELSDNTTEVPVDETTVHVSRMATSDCNHW